MDTHEVLLECLEELDSEEMKLFKWHLNQGINDFKIPKSQLENKQRFEIVDCMIQRYRRDDAGKLTLLVLEKMKKMDLKERLLEKLGDTLQSKQTEAGTAQKQETRTPVSTGAEFVEQHRTELIRRVSLVEPIADDMKRLIGEEKYQIILKSGTPRAQMRALLDFLTTAELKEKLYQSLLEHEQYLVKDLEDSG